MYLKKKEALRKQKEEEKRLLETKEREKSLKRTKSLIRKRGFRTPRKSSKMSQIEDNGKSDCKLSATSKNKIEFKKSPFKRSGSYLTKKNKKNQKSKKLNLEKCEEPRVPLVVPSPQFTESFSLENGSSTLNTYTTNNSIVGQENPNLNILLQEPEKTLKSSKLSNGSSSSSSSEFLIEDFTLANNNNNNKDSIPNNLTFKKSQK